MHHFLLTQRQTRGLATANSSMLIRLSRLLQMQPATRFRTSSTTAANGGCSPCHCSAHDARSALGAGASLLRRNHTLHIISALPTCKLESCLHCRKPIKLISLFSWLRLATLSQSPPMRAGTSGTEPRQHQPVEGIHHSHPALLLPGSTREPEIRTGSDAPVRTRSACRIHLSAVHV